MQFKILTAVFKTFIVAQRARNVELKLLKRKFTKTIQINAYNVGRVV
jgi:hypothetical protein